MIQSFLMTTKDAEETRGPQNHADAGGDARPHRSFTTLSTIAVQAGDSQIVVSVLQVGKEINCMF